MWTGTGILRQRFERQSLRLRDPKAQVACRAPSRYLLSLKNVLHCLLEVYVIMAVLTEHFWLMGEHFATGSVHKCTLPLRWAAHFTYAKGICWKVLIIMCMDACPTAGNLRSEPVRGTIIFAYTSARRSQAACLRKRQAALKSLDRIIAEHKARLDAAQPSAGSVLSNIASTVAQAAVGGGEVCPECMIMTSISVEAVPVAVHESCQAVSMRSCRL